MRLRTVFVSTVAAAAVTAGSALWAGQSLAADVTHAPPVVVDGTPVSPAP